MKTLTLSTLMLVIAIATSSFVISHNQVSKEATAKIQNIGTLRAHRMGKAIALDWTVSGGNAAKFNIERSFDGEYFDVISSVDCIGASRYNFKDQEFFPGYIYYRVSSVDANGDVLETSAVEVVRIVQRK